jgi:UDP-N-acetylglucosamine--N-acetylmuramyl-(pentapeptide) pyrophosphoryl-undecaprenol N-acetylglucosamine transferase
VGTAELAPEVAPAREARAPARRRVILIAGGGTGGHLMPALAIATRLREERPDLEPVLLGATRGIEAQLLPTRDFRFHLLPVEPLYRRQWWKNAGLPLMAMRVVKQLKRIFATERPVAVLGTGGYASGPAVWLATKRGIPTAIQEQNAFPGLATRMLSRRVRQVYLGLPEARARLRFGAHTEVFDTGNPIAPPDPSRRGKAVARFGLAGEERPVVLITGGSQGALAINETVAGWLDRGGARDCTVLWATGRGSYDRFVAYHRPPRVQVFGFLDPMADGYAVADLVVARAGMMTGAELCAWGLPSLLIPLPTSAEDHQRHNAAALAGAGAAVMLEQKNLTPESFGEEVGALLGDRARRERMAQAARERGKPRAAEEIVARLVALAGG